MLDKAFKAFKDFVEKQPDICYFRQIDNHCELMD